MQQNRWKRADRFNWPSIWTVLKKVRIVRKIFSSKLIKITSSKCFRERTTFTSMSTKDPLSARSKTCIWYHWKILLNLPQQNRVETRLCWCPRRLNWMTVPLRTKFQIPMKSQRTFCRLRASKPQHLSITLRTWVLYIRLSSNWELGKWSLKDKCTLWLVSCLSSVVCQNWSKG